MTLLRFDDPPPDKLPIYARSGWRIPLANVIEEDPRIVQIRAQELQNWFPSATLRSVSAYPYNCMGLVFASRRAWIEIDHVYDVLREDGYRRITLNEVMEGDLVLYERNGEAAHIGVIMIIDRSLRTPNIKVMSKWGVDAEFIHFIDNLPVYLGKPAEYYTDRR